MDYRTAASTQVFAEVRGQVSPLQPSKQLGPLEKELMDVIWSGGPGNVRDIVCRAGRKLAYTTVMTTLTRLHKKGFLQCDTAYRAFVYSARFTEEEWKWGQARELVKGLLSGPDESRSLLLSCLIDAVGAHDDALLDELSEQIERKREELAQKNPDR